jgi:serine O-acetyltransferase
MLYLIKRFNERYHSQGFKNATEHVYLFIKRIFKIRTACDIRASLPNSTSIPHPVGIVIGKDVKLGNNVMILQNVTLGVRLSPASSGSQPQICDNVIIGAGACILGNVKIGRNSVIGANSVVLDDIPQNVVAAGVPARIVGERRSNSK